jgi:eukaryotic-like serine/threonine-protein kinase
MSSEDSASGDGATSSDAAPRTIGRYALHAEIASGGMATVHIGRLLGPVGFARTVAIKRLHPPLAKDPEFVAMFLDEARLAARIRHPNVVSTLDVVATEGELFVVMEYVPGESLARLLRVVRTAKEMVPVPIAATIMVGVLHGLHAAHEARDERGDPLRIVHRDVSPHNILVGTDGDAHLIDFGIAKARGRMQVTRQGQIKGKLSYMPAEQLMGQGLDHRADIFAAAIVLWEALTGQRLFQGVDDGDVYAKVLLGKVDPPSLHAKGLSPTIDAIVLRGLARDREQRYATAREMALAIEAAIPLAPPSHVGRWVEALVGDSLAERTEQIAGIERLVDSGEATSSALMTIGAGVPRPANEQHDVVVTGARALSTSGRDRTSPTQPLGTLPAGMTEPTVVDRPAAGAVATESAGDVAHAPRRGRRRFAMVLALLFVSLAAYGGLRAVRSGGVSTMPWLTAKASPVETHAAGPTPPVPAPRASSDWLPVPMSSPSGSAASSETQAVGPVTASTSVAGVGAKKASPQTAQSARPVAPRGQAAPQPTEVTETPAAAPTARPSIPNAASCDPPFYIDADGTKRYKRYCANL